MHKESNQTHPEGDQTFGLVSWTSQCHEKTILLKLRDLRNHTSQPHTSQPDVMFGHELEKPN